MKSIIAVLLLTISVNPVRAQTAPSSDSLSELMTWVGTQQAQVGTSVAMNGVKYAATWWDAFSVGQTGTNVGRAGALDYLDIGPGMAVANAERTRYGSATPVHIGNIWNLMEQNSTGTWMSHVHVRALPNVIVCPFFLWPQGNQIGRWTWKKDFQAAIGYKFGGSGS